MKWEDIQLHAVERGEGIAEDRTMSSQRDVCPCRLGFTIAVLVAAPGAWGQVPIELTVEGQSTVVENTYADYTATALFDNGEEFEVTLLCDWSVDPETYAHIDEFGRLTTEEVSENQAIVVSASFTWDDVTLDDSIDVTIFDVPPKEGGDPWPFWGRTATRLGRTATVGPQTPTIEWSVVFSTHWSESIREASPVMDQAGRIFVGTAGGVTAIDSFSREMLWEFKDGDGNGGAALWDGRVVWADFSPFSTIYCYDAASGEEIWTFQAENGITAAPVVDPTGVVYVMSQVDITFQFGIVYARRIEDGSEVWTVPLGDQCLNSPSLDWPFLLTSGGYPTLVDLAGLDPLTGDTLWSFHAEDLIYGLASLVDGRVYFGSWDRYLYCLDAESGEEIWSFWCEQINRGSVAIGHDGTIYTATSGGVGILFALSPDGDELWRYELPGLVSNAPIVAGDGIIYLCSSHWTGSDYESRVHAIRPDGTELWAKLMPDDVRASPMLAPDGTLYVVCRDKILYAFHDPVPGDMDGDYDVDAADLALLLGSWGPCPAEGDCPADLDGDGTVGPFDLALLLGAWGPC